MEEVFIVNLQVLANHSVLTYSITSQNMKSVVLDCLLLNFTSVSCLSENYVRSDPHTIKAVDAVLGEMRNVDTLSISF